ncbi:MAG: ATP synthase F1 subunit gamma [Candidatus Gracilibacteria bacterium]|nr:ATP synthase F1 subunit gamma [Candidatus Gracilibacteria bacterium]
MAGSKEIKARIKSVKNTGKITKAMELISTVKMKKAQESAVHARPLALEAARVLRHLGNISDSNSLSLNEPKELILVIASNKGLCGGYNVNVFKEIANEVRNNPEMKFEFVTAGKRARDFVQRTGQKLVGDFSDVLKDTITPKDAKLVSRFLQKLFLEGGYSRVRIVYSHFLSAINQKPIIKTLLPLTEAEIVRFFEDIGAPISQGTSHIEYEFEPSIEVITETILPMIYDLIVYEGFLEAKASEHASRMIAMKNAKDSANKKVKGLTLSFNKARQANITKEVSEIVSGVESMKD